MTREDKAALFTYAVFFVVMFLVIGFVSGFSTAAFIMGSSFGIVLALGAFIVAVGSIGMRIFKDEAEDG